MFLPLWFLSYFLFFSFFTWNPNTARNWYWKFTCFVASDDGKFVGDPDVGEFWSLFGGYAPIPRDLASAVPEQPDISTVKLFWSVLPRVLETYQPFPFLIIVKSSSWYMSVLIRLHNGVNSSTKKWWGWGGGGGRKESVCVLISSVHNFESNQV